MRTPCYFALLCLPLLAICAGCADVPPTAAAAELLAPIELVDSTATTAARQPHYIGRVSCAASGCHGHNAVTPVSWNNAYQLWDSSDPHRWAFDVLYTERSYNIYAKLEQPASETVDQATYLIFLQQKCIGCHATPPVGTPLTRAGMPERFTATDAEVFSQGVSCESCHGAASDWEGRHFLKDWQTQDADPAGRAKLTADHHFQDLRPLANRAEVCAKCHIGPQKIGASPNEMTYDVNHDLIAAGHPRLNFEFNAYLTNLPKHWDEATISKKQGRSQIAFHFETWRAGQVQKLRQVAALEAKRPLGRWVEFANHDCRECHHPLGEWRQKSSSPNQDSQTMTSAATIPGQAALLLALFQRTKRSEDTQPMPGFDEAVDLYLAATAFSQDRSQSALTTAVSELGAAIERQHKQHGGRTQYDLISKFNPQADDFQRAIRNLETELNRFSP